MSPPAVTLGRAEPGPPLPRARVPATPDGERQHRTTGLLWIVSTVGAVQVATMACGLLRSKLLALSGGPEGVGLVSVIDQVVALVAQACTLGLPFAAVKLLSAAHSEGPEPFRQVYGAFLRTLTLSALAGAGLAVAITLAFPGILPPELAVVRTAVILALLAVPATNLLGLLTNTLAAAGRSRGAAMLGFALAFSMGIFPTVGFLLARVTGYYTGALFAPAAVVAVGLWLLSRSEGLSPSGGPLRLVELGRREPGLYTLGASFFLLSCTTPLAFLVARSAIVHVGGMEAAGLLQAGMGPALAFATVLRAGNALVLTPIMNRRTPAQQKQAEAIRFLQVYALALGVCGLPLVLFPRVWLSLLYSAQFLDVAPWVWVFVLAEALGLLAGVQQALMVGVNDIAVHAGFVLSGHVVIAAVSFVLAPVWGVGAVALALTLNALLLLGLTGWRLRSRFGLGILRAQVGFPLLTVLVLLAAGLAASLLPNDTLGTGIVRAGAWLMFLLVSSFWLLRRSGSSAWALVRRGPACPEVG